MENLNAEAVKKALECCVDGDCYPCPYAEIGAGCRDKMSENALALINSQEQRIEELTEENERLREKADRNLENLKAVLEERNENTIVADTVQKMQERLDKRFCHDPAFLGVEQRLIMGVIDQIAKEMLEGEE